MDAVDIGAGELIEWGVAARALPGETRSGDAYVVEPFSNGVLVAAVDGLGHGDEAADAAKAATEILSRNATESLVALVKRCHEGLWGTRGVAMTLASFGATSHTMTWLGVGNVEASLMRSKLSSSQPRESLIQRGGVVGYRLPKLRTSVASVGPGDTIVLSTDGIEGPFLEGQRMSDPPATIAENILAGFARATDDALVLVVRYRGAAQ